MKQEEDKGFEEFWSIQLRKLDKGHARKAWKKALRLKPAAEIIEAYKKFAARMRAEKKDLEFVPYPGTWLNGERWADEPENIGASQELKGAALIRWRVEGFVKRKFWKDEWGPKPDPSTLKEFGLQP
jgi:hypothetical protein